VKGGSGPKVHVPKAPQASKPKTKIHPAAAMRVRLPTGEVNMGQSDPGVSAPGIGRF
jgi:hypothetical protein